MKRVLFFLAPFVTSLLAYASFPPVGIGLVAWVAFVPLVVYARREKKGWRAFFVAWAAGWCFYMPAYWWISPAAPVGPYLLGFYMGLYFGLFAILVRVLSRRFPLILVVPTMWISIEFVQAHLFSGLPWFLFAYTQHELLAFIQMADLLGPWLVTGVVLAGNAAVARGVVARLEGKVLMRDREFRLSIGTAAILISAATLYGMARLDLPIEDGPRVGIVQPNVAQSVKKLSDSPVQAREIYRKHREMTRRLLSAGEGVDLILWPESVIYQGLVYDTIGKKWDPDVSRLYSLREFSSQLGIPILFGTEVIDVDERGYEKTESTNSAILVDPKKGFHYRFNKVHLVPFSERIPRLPGVEYFTEKYTGAKRLMDFKPGVDYDTFSVGGVEGGAMICFENAFPEISRKIARKGGRFIVNLSNEGWFLDGAELDHMLIMSRFRAVESRVAIVRCTNTGISAIIEPTGRVASKIEGKEVAGLLRGRVRLTPGGSLYRIVGDVLAWVACGAVLLMMAWAAVRRKLTGPGAGPIVSPQSS